MTEARSAQLPAGDRRADDIDRLSLAPGSPAYEQMICVLLPAAAHHRVNSVLRRANPTRLSATASELEPAYRDAYNLVGNYCGSSEAAISQELFNIFKAVLKNIVQAAAAVRNSQLAKARSELERLEHEIDLQKSLHNKLLRDSSPHPLQTAAFITSMANPLTAAAALVSPASRSVFGGGVNMLNPVKRPELNIWARAEASAQAANQALTRGDLAGAVTAITVGHAHFLTANTHLERWRDAIPLAGRRAELAIGATAAAATVVAIGVYALEATAAAGAQAAGVSQTQTGVRVVEEVGTKFRVLVEAETLAEEQLAEREIGEVVSEGFKRMAAPKPHP